MAKRNSVGSMQQNMHSSSKNFQPAYGTAQDDDVRSSHKHFSCILPYFLVRRIVEFAVLWSPSSPTSWWSSPCQCPSGDVLRSLGVSMNFHQINEISLLFRSCKNTRELSSSDLADLYLEEPGVPVSSLSFLVLIFMRKLTWGRRPMMSLLKRLSWSGKALNHFYL